MSRPIAEGDVELALQDGSVSPSRDLDLAKKAFSDKNREASRLAHSIGGNPGVDGALVATEMHAKGGEFIKSMVFGGLDGIITTFAIVAAVEGGHLSQSTVILMGFANLIADAISMGLGDFISEKAEMDYVAAEQRRENWEMENYPEGEVKEMIEIYEARGMTTEDATTVINVLAKYPKIMVDTMMVEELGLLPQGDDDDKYAAHKKACVTFGSFILFGSVPLLVYVSFFTVDFQTDIPVTFIIASVATAITLFILGAAKARFTKQNTLKSGLWMLLNGTFAASSAYLVGYVLDLILGGVEGC